MSCPVDWPGEPDGDDDEAFPPHLNEEEENWPEDGEDDE